MDHSVAVGKRQRAGDVGCDRRRPGRFERSLGDQLGQRPAIDVLHHDEVGPRPFAPVVDGNDVRVGEVGGRLRLSTESPHEGLIDRELGEEDLEGHGAVEQQVFGQVHLGHAAPGYVADQLIAIVEDLGVLLGHRRKPTVQSRSGTSGQLPSAA